MKRLFYLAILCVGCFTSLNLFGGDVSVIRAGDGKTSNPFFDKNYKICYRLTWQPDKTKSPCVLFVFLKESTALGTTQSVWQINQESGSGNESDIEKVKNISSETAFKVMKSAGGAYKYKFVLPALPKFIRVNFLDYVTYWKVVSVSGQIVDVSIPSGSGYVSDLIKISSSKVNVTDGDVSSWKAGQILVPFVMKKMNAKKVTGDQSSGFTLINLDTSNYVTGEFTN